ncbi:MAG: guanylate cyclase [Gammaproteobacteria bacterium]|nr:MAG: guanylate cyclase [Gammaproteobacteria bacterium]
MTPRRLLRLTVCLLLAAAFLAHALGWWRIGLIDTLERFAYDSRLRLTAPGGVDERIVIVDFDERSIERFGWPWPRRELAAIVDRLFDHYGVELAAFDMVFAEPDARSPLPVLDALGAGPLADDTAFHAVIEQRRGEWEYDRRFADSLRGRPVLLGFVFHHDDGRRKGLLPEPLGEGLIDPAWKRRLPIPEARGHLGNLPELQAAAAGGGFFDNPLVDDDGVFRRVPLLQLYQDRLYPSLALAVARAALDTPPLEIVVVSSGTGRGDYNAIEAIRLGERRVPVDARTAALVPYRGPRGSFPYVSAVDVLDGRAARETLAGKIVLLGTTAAGLMDLRATPVAAVYPGVEVHANLVAGILDGSLRQAPSWIQGLEVVLLLAVALALGIAPLFLSALGSTALAGGLAAALLGLDAWLWSHGLVAPLAAPLLLLVLLYLWQSAYGHFIESRNKRALARVFGQYIPPELVDELDRRGGRVELEGESRELTVLFSDVRGFTRIAERLDPKTLSRLMNIFLSALTEAIHRHRGTIDKYMGDAVMAFWGAPLEDPLHARHALEGAFEMLRVVRALEDDFRARGWPVLHVGIGLNSGPMRVGNMGSRFRMAYTVLGDAVNLGARLEALTRRYGVDLIVGESVKAQAPDYVYLELDRVRVKGKAEPVTIYAPLGPRETVDKAQRLAARRFGEALLLYRRGDFDAAERELFALASAEPDRLLYRLYLERILHFRQHPPPPGLGRRVRLHREMTRPLSRRRRPGARSPAGKGSR